ncbi:MAG: LamG domain-containing protein [Kiritimatiellia bacterium]|jgi:hypothetical protein
MKAKNTLALFGVLATVMGACAGTDHVVLTGDGSDGGLCVASGDFKMTTSTYTVEAWVRPSTIGKENPIMDQFVGATAGDWSFVVYASNDAWGTVALFTRGLQSSKASNWLQSNTVLPINRWSHVAIAVDGSTVKFYLNGVLDKTHTIISGGGTIPAPSGTFRIGMANRGGGKSFSGNISDCRVWHAVRTEAEIASTRFVRLSGGEPGLAAYWPLDEGGGSSVGNKVAGTTDAITGGTFGWVDLPTPFVTCDVSGNHVLANTAGAWVDGRVSTGGFRISGNAFSLECWVRPTSLLQNNTLFDQFGSVASEGDLRLSIVDSSKVGLFYRGFGAANWMYGKSLVPMYKWTHIAATCDGDEVKLYVDGGLETTAARTAPDRIAPNGSVALGLLGYSLDNAYNRAMNGRVSDMRVWNRALSASEIATNRFSRLTSHEEGLVGYWPFGETSGTVATNYAPTARGAFDGVISDNYAFESCAAMPFVEPFGEVDDASVLAGGRFDTQMRIWHPAYTMEAWIRLDGHGNNVVFSQFKNGLNGDLRMTVNDQGRLSGFLRGFISGNWVYSSATIPLYTWTHVALSYDGEKMRLYINGEKDSEFTGETITPNQTTNLFAGGTEDGALGFDGRLSDLRIWDSARTDAEIAANHVDRLTGGEPRLQGYWPLGQTTGDTVFNGSRQGVADGVADGTLTWLCGETTPFYYLPLTLILR